MSEQETTLGQDVEDLFIKQFIPILKGKERQVLSDEVENYFLEQEVRYVIKGGNYLLPMSDNDDRTANNWNNILLNFEFKKENGQPCNAEETFEIMQQTLVTNPNNEEIADFIVRVPAEYLKLLIYYAKVNSFKDLSHISNYFYNKMEEIKKDENFCRNFCKHEESFRFHITGFLKNGDKRTLDFPSFISAVPGNIMESMIQRTKVNSVDDFCRLFLETPYTLLFMFSVNSNLAKEIMKIAEVNSVDSMLALTKNNNFMNALLNTKSSEEFPKNLRKAIEHFRINDQEKIQELIESKKLIELMETASFNNFSTLLRKTAVKNIIDLERICNNRFLLENIKDTNYEVLIHFLKNLGIDNEKIGKYFYEVITHSYEKKVQQQIEMLSSLLEEKHLLPNSLNNVILDFLQDEDYIQQNLDSITKLVKDNFVTTDEEVNSLIEIKGYMGGFITPVLSQHYLKAKTIEDKEKVLQSYKDMMKQVLGSSTIEIYDLKMMAEIIFLAYKPTGYSISEVEELIDSRSSYCLEDLTPQLNEINFKHEGYTMHFNLVGREQTEKYNVKLLRGIDTPLVSTSRIPIEDLLFQTLSNKPKHKDATSILFGKIINNINDDRVTSYKENYLSEKGVSQEYTEQRIQNLKEIFGIIPKEDVFYKTLNNLLESNEEFRNIAERNAERFLWIKNKSRFSQVERATKNKLDEIIKHLEKDSNCDVSELIATLEFSPIKDSIANLSGLSLYERLKAIRSEKYLRDKNRFQRPTDVYYQVLLDYSKSCVQAIRKEIRKVRTVKQDEVKEVRAVLSKNVGSYFAKAGAEICTSHNREMWEEKRHVHLNLVHKNQIIGNVMLYFEPERDYLIARGFNPRKDVMMEFDRYSMAIQITSVLEDIAEANGFKEIFVPEQTGFHALSNRDGMASEIEQLCKGTEKKILSINPTQRTYIDNANFHITSLDQGVKVQRLNLLSNIDYK